MPPKAQELETTGRCWFRNALAESELHALERACLTDQRPGARLGLAGDLRELLASEGTTPALAHQLLPESKPVRIVAFNKSASTNWSVPWHQDRVIAVAQRHDVEGFGGWSNKDGVWHCEPPIAILSAMIFARIHFDDTDEKNGCFELALGTHAHGWIASDQAHAVASSAPREICTAKRGDVLFVKALALHRSASSKTGDPRRALRVDYVNLDLRPPLEWACETA